MASDTFQKYLEASFFKDKLSASAHDPKEYSYYLSAFVTSARSVTMIMDSEFSSCPGYKEWRASQSYILSQGIFKYFNEHRRRNIHIKPFERPWSGIVHGDISSGSTLIVFTYSGTEGTNSLIRISDEVLQRRMKEVRGRFDYFFDDITDKSVEELCTIYLAELSNLIAQAEVRFGS